MRLKFYLLGGLASAFCLQASAQNSAEYDKRIHSHILAPEIEQNTKIDYSTAGVKSTLFTNEFDDASEWLIINEGEQGTWAVVTEEDTDVLDFMGAMNSATEENGFGQFNGISFLLSGDVELQNSILQYDGTIDCSTLDAVAFTFNQRARAFNYDQHFVEISNDGGNSWVPFLVNDDLVTNAPAIQGELTLDISTVAANEPDVRIRFRWVSDPLSQNPEITEEEIDMFGSGYGWMVDDICIAAPPANELIIGETYFDDHFETIWVEDGFFVAADENVTDIDQVTSFEYHTRPDYSTSPFNFAAIVTNGGTDEQTGVTLEITFTDPDGESWMGFSDAISLASGETDTIRYYGIVPDNWAINGEQDLPNGLYSIDYRILQDQEDELPGNNVGVSRFTRLRDDSSEGGAYIQFENSLTQQGLDGQDIITGNRFSFTPGDEMRAITSIRFALNDASIDGVGEQVFLNVRTGGVLDENPNTTLFFSYDEDDEDAIIYEVQEEDLSTTSTPVWVEVELPSPVLIEPNVIYQAEMSLPLFGQELIFVGLTSTRNAQASVIFDNDDGTWGAFGSSVYNLSLGTEIITSVPQISYESGIKLTQNFPNPVVNNTSFQFQLDEASAVTFEVFDITGKLVYSEDLGEVPALSNRLVEFNRVNLAPGTYTYGIATENERLTRKMIIQ
jgi:hypothetical protein